MKRRNDETSKRRNGDGAAKAPSHFDVSTFRRFDVCEAPDMTRRIMGRLGYMRVSPKVARRQRIRSWMNRSGLVLAAALAVGVGFRVYENSPDLRRPHDLTIPAAIGNDLQHHRDRIGNVINVIRNLTTPAETAPATTEEQGDQEPQFIDDLSPPAGASFRWV